MNFIKYIKKYLNPPIVKLFSLSISFYIYKYSKSFSSNLYTFSPSFYYLENKPQKNNEYLTILVCELEELKKKTFIIINNPINNKKIGIFNLEDGIYAISIQCPYDDSFLMADYLINDKIFCPIHLSSFSIKTGIKEYGPDLEDLLTYEIYQENNKVYIKIPKNIINSNIINYKKIYGIPDFRKIVFLGNDPGVISCIQNLRINGFLGEIYLIISCNNNELPYDMTKKLMIGNGYLRDEEFYNKMNVKIINEKVKKVNFDDFIIEFESFPDLHFSNVVLSNGVSHKFPHINLIGMKNIFFMNNNDELNQIIDLNNNNKKIVIIGLNFHSLKIANSLKHNKNNIIIIEKKRKDFEKTYGSEIAILIEKLCFENNIIINNNELKEINSDNEGKISSINLKNGDTIKTDVLLFQEDFFPNTDLLKSSLRIDENGGIYTDIFLKTCRDNIFGLGGVISLNSVFDCEKKMICKNINESSYQGYIVAMNILGKKIPYFHIPFNSVKIGKKILHYVGDTSEHDFLIKFGEENNIDFINLYFKNKILVGATSFTKIRELILVRECMKKCKFSKLEMFDNEFNWENLKKIIENYNLKKNNYSKSLN